MNLFELVDSGILHVMNIGFYYEKIIMEDAHAHDDVFVPRSVVAWLC